MLQRHDVNKSLNLSITVSRDFFCVQSRSLTWPHFRFIPVVMATFPVVDDVISGPQPRSHARPRSVLVSLTRRAMHYSRYQSPKSAARPHGHVGHMRLSDWLTKKILRSDWLSVKPTPCTTNKVDSVDCKAIECPSLRVWDRYNTFLKPKENMW